jgi:sugar phosphate isomerase/epimerase
MELGLVLDPRLDRTWEEALDTVVRHGLTFVEPCAGGHIPKVYFDPVHLNSDAEAREEFRESIDSRGLRIAALGCHGNPVHPDRRRAAAHHADYVATCELAAKLGVSRVDLISGCPAGGPTDKSPNWIINSLFPDFKNAYRWQWEECLIPYWKEASKIALDNNVRICVEPHGGDMVYNGETFLRLRDACGDVIGLNLDPSHLWWMGIDPIQMIHELGDAIYFVHAKDVSFDRRRIGQNGLTPTCDYDDWNARSWVYCAIGNGHPEEFWAEYVTALRRAGYDDAVIIELEDPFMTMDDALSRSVATMKAVVPTEPVPSGNWFDKYEWETAEV